MKIIEFKNEYGIKKGKMTIWGMTEEEAQKIYNLAKKNRWGWWQVSIARDLLQGYLVPAEPFRLVKGRASNYRSKYLRSLENVATALGAEYVPGPRGGRWKGFYVLKDKK